MKLKFNLLLFILFQAFHLFGQNMTEEKVIANAEQFLQKREQNLKSTQQFLKKNEQILKSTKSFNLIKLLENKENKNKIYIHNLGIDQGWIITENIGDELVVLGYSLSGSFDYDKSVPYVKTWLSVNLDSISPNNFKAVEVNPKQDYYRLEPFLKTKEGKFIQWDQYPLYNEACPVINGVKTPVGCGATALGQLIRFWEFPNKSRSNISYDYVYTDRDSFRLSLQHSFGERAYNWNQMPVSLTDSSSTDEIEEVSELLFDIGLSIKTAYWPTGSSIGGQLVMGFHKYFNYTRPSEISIYDQISGLKNSTDSLLFHSQVIDNLDKGYPVLVTGFVGDGFHMMVCDGYDNEGYYHLNYGWSGESDGFYHFSNNVWCGNQLLFQMAYVNIIPSDLNYSCSLLNYHAIVKAGRQDSLIIKIEEEDQSFPFYIEPILKIKTNNGLILSPEFTYTLNPEKSQVLLNYQTPFEEGDYDFNISFKTGKDTIRFGNLGLKVDNGAENISGDIQIVSMNSVNNFNYESPSINIKVQLKNKMIKSTIYAKSELISDLGLVEYSSEKEFSLTNDSTQIEFDFPLHDIPFGNKQLKVSIDSDNRISETDETNNSLFIPVSFNREIPVSEWKTLRDFYLNNNGNAWIHKKGWLTNEPIGTWDGVTVDEGHVKELTNHIFNYNKASAGFMSGTGEVNSFNGSGFPKNLDKLSKLEVLYFFGAQMNDSVPKSLMNIKSLKSLELYQCELYGKIPEEVGELTNLETLKLNFNFFTGDIPYSIFNLKKLEYLQLCGNRELSGNIDSIGKLNNLIWLNLSNTKIGGTLPSDIFNLQKLKIFDITSCYFNGPIPIVERLNEQLIGFRVSNSGSVSNTNQLEGDIFKTLVHCKKLKWVALSNNQFTGSIPSEIVGMKDVQQFDLSNNNFESMKPISKDSLSKDLYQFSVENNKLEFQSFENNLELLNDNFFTYAPQDSVGEEIFANVVLGEDFLQHFSCSGSNNIYQWFHNGSAMGETSTNGDLFIENVSASDIGKYVCVISNSLIDQLSLYSKPVNVLYQLELAVSTNNIQLDNDEGSSSSIDVYSNTSWSVTSNQSWLSLSTNEGAMNGQVIITAGANSAFTPRPASVVISANGVESQVINITQKARTSVNVNQYELSHNLIYPNPATEFIFINGLEKNASISIFNLDGILLIKKSIFGDERILISNLIAGIYLVKVETKTKSMVCKLIVN